MIFQSLSEFTTTGLRTMRKGPFCLIFVEDDVEIDSTITRVLAQGFARVLVFAPREWAGPSPQAGAAQDQVCHIIAHPATPGVAAAAVNALMDAVAGQWMCCLFNAEYLFFPFSDTRCIADFIDFQENERRGAVFTTVVDLYAPDLNTAPNGVDLEAACFDRAAYFGRQRYDQSGTPLERQIDLFGGLRWRFEDFVPFEQRRIDRIAVFKAQRGLRLRPDFTLSDPERNTFQSKWHHSATAAIVSFRAAKALRSLPDARVQISKFVWPQSERFEWRAQQLLDHGIIEPGQWF
jgi:hypothetical protein